MGSCGLLSVWPFVLEPKNTGGKYITDVCSMCKWLHDDDEIVMKLTIPYKKCITDFSYFGNLQNDVSYYGMSDEPRILYIIDVKRSCKFEILTTWLYVCLRWVGLDLESEALLLRNRQRSVRSPCMRAATTHLSFDDLVWRGNAAVSHGDFQPQSVWVYVIRIFLIRPPGNDSWPSRHYILPYVSFFLSSFFFSPSISEVVWPIVTKFCRMFGRDPNLQKLRQKFWSPLPRKTGGTKVTQRRLAHSLRVKSNQNL